MSQNGSELDLRRSLLDAASDLRASAGLKQRVLVRARVRRRMTLSVGVVLAACLVAGAVIGLSSIDRPDDASEPLPPIGSVSIEATTATPVGDRSRGCPTWEEAPATGEPDLPSDARCAWMVENDLDGDGSSDRFYSYGMPDQDARDGYLWFVTAVLASGEDVEPLELDDAYLPSLIGATDADQDGDADVFVTVQSGASGSLLGIFQVVDGEIVEVSGGPAKDGFSLSGVANHLLGLECRGAGDEAKLLVLQAAKLPDGSAEWGEEVYLWDGTSFAQTGVNGGKIPADDPSLERFGELDCFGLES